MTNKSSSKRAHLTQPIDEDLAGLLGGPGSGNSLGFEQEVYSAEDRQRIKKRRRNTMLTAVLVFAVAAIMVIAIIAPQAGWFKTKNFSGSGNGTQVSFVVKNGASTSQVANELEQQGVIADASHFVQTYNQINNGKYIQPGQYQLQEHMSDSSALNVLLALEKGDQIYLAVAQNWRITDTFKAMVDTGAVSQADLTALNKNPSQFGIPSKFPTLEGWLHPGEYYFAKGTSAKDMIQQMVDKTKADLSTAGVSGDERIFHVLTEASILEFEGTPKDYSAIAGAIENRINHPNGETSGFIQSDATVAYGLGLKTYQITNAQKQDATNKYNTFYYKGLPVGPIGSPALDAIKASANPQKNNYFYWVTVNLDTGETKYASTYTEHEQNVEEYQNWCSSNPGKCQ